MLIPWTAPKYPPFGRCVYCGATESLTDEHVIPNALLPKGGDWFLPKASCRSCAAMTRDFESAAIAMFAPLRAQLDLKKRRKQTGRVNVQFNYRDGSLVNQEIDASQLPRYASGFRWPIPGIVLGHPPIQRFVGEFVINYGDPEKMNRLATPERITRLVRAAPDHFGRMLAKIAYVFAIAVEGQDAFDPLILPYIKGESDCGPYLVGGDHSGVPHEHNWLHSLFFRDARRESGPSYFGVSIQLFRCFTDMPMYHVILGRRLKEAPPSHQPVRIVAITVPFVGG